MKQKFICIFLSLSLFMGMSGIISVMDSNPVQAATLKNKLNNIQEKQEQNEKDQKKKQSELDQIKEEMTKMQSEIEQFDVAILQTNDKINTKQQDINKTKEVIGQLKDDISEILKRIDTRDKLLKERVRSMYESGGAINYIEVILGARSFGDFLDRIVGLNLIAEQDKSILEEHKADKVELEKKRTKVETKLSSLETDMVELKNLKNELNEKVEQKNELLNTLKEKEGVLYSEYINIEEVSKNLKAQEAAIKQEIKKQEERERQQEMKKQDNRVQQQSTKPNLSTSKTVKEVGNFIWPTQGRLTSSMGERWNKYHAGIDIAKSGKVPVIASASGTVFRSYYSSSYGNVVFITHYVDGQLYTTVSAHMRSRSVRSGQSVSKGQVIGYQGNTGKSFGQHLHFELHKGQWNADKSNAVNPLDYLK